MKSDIISFTPSRPLLLAKKAYVQVIATFSYFNKKENTLNVNISEQSVTSNKSFVVMFSQLNFDWHIFDILTCIVLN